MSTVNEFLKRCAAEVAAWPLWKQNTLGWWREAEPEPQPAVEHYCCTCRWVRPRYATEAEAVAAGRLWVGDCKCPVPPMTPHSLQRELVDVRYGGQFCPAWAAKEQHETQDPDAVRQ